MIRKEVFLSFTIHKSLNSQIVINEVIWSLKKIRYLKFNFQFSVLSPLTMSDYGTGASQALTGVSFGIPVFIYIIIKIFQLLQARGVSI